MFSILLKLLLHKRTASEYNTVKMTFQAIGKKIFGGNVYACFYLWHVHDASSDY